MTPRPRPLVLVYVHGVQLDDGASVAGFSEWMHSVVCASVPGVALHREEVVWADEQAGRQHAYARWLISHGRWDMLRALFVGLGGDAFGYRSRTRERILARVDAAVEAAPPDAGIILVGHSWGGVIAHDWAVSRCHPRLSGLFTMASPLPLTWGEDGPRVPRFMGWKEGDRPRWWSRGDRDDIVFCPVLWPGDEEVLRGRVDERYVTVVGGQDGRGMWWRRLLRWVIGGTPAVHTMCWDDVGMVGEVAGLVRRVATPVWG